MLLRISELIEHRLIQLRLGAFGDQVDLLGELRREIVYEALEAAEGAADGHHANAQHAVP